MPTPSTDAGDTTPGVLDLAAAAEVLDPRWAEEFLRLQLAVLLREEADRIFDRMLLGGDWPQLDVSVRGLPVCGTQWWLWRPPAVGWDVAKRSGKRPPERLGWCGKAERHAPHPKGTPTCNGFGMLAGGGYR